MQTGITHSWLLFYQFIIGQTFWWISFTVLSYESCILFIYFRENIEYWECKIYSFIVGMIFQKVDEFYLRTLTTASVGMDVGPACKAGAYLKL